jgi:hypothetical protein
MEVENDALRQDVERLPGGTAVVFVPGTEEVLGVEEKGAPLET